MVRQSNQPRRANRLLCATFAAVGALVAAVGSCAILYIYAFAAMVPPDLIGWDRWKLILQKMLLTSSAVVVLFGVLALGVGIAMVTVSLQTAFGKSVRNTQRINSIVVLAVVELVLGVLVAFFA